MLSFRSKRKHYKLLYADLDMINKRGQITIAVIIAIAIVGIVLVIFLFPGVNLFVSDVNPSSFLRKCIEPEVRDTLDVITRQGGYSQPTNYITYEGDGIQFLCYTSDNYLPCVVQQPLLKQHMEQEIKDRVSPVAVQCIRDLEEQYEKQGYTVERSPGELNVSFVPGNLVVEFLSPISVSKETTQEFRKFAVNINSEMYELIFIAQNIIAYESEFGDSEITLYVQLFPDIKVEKIKREGDTIYKLTNVVTDDRFTFASRSLVWPPGYAIEGTE